MERLEGRALMAVLGQGDIAILAINSANPDRFAFTPLKNLDAGDVISFTDNGFTGGATGRTGEGFLTYTAPANVSAGTVITWQNGQNISGTGWSSNAPTNFALNGSGDQLFAFTGATGNWAGQSGITLIYGVNFGIALSATSGASNTVQPTNLTTAFLNLPTATNANGYFSGTGSAATNVTVSGTPASLLSDFVTASKWVGTTAAAATFPTYNITVNSSAAPTLSIAATSASKAEGNSGTTSFTFDVTRTVDTTGTSTVNYAITGGTTNPANEADFGGTFPSGSVTFDPGDTTKTITINVSGDTAVELNEAFVVTLSGPSSPAVIGTATANGTIQNDDSSFGIAALSASKLEGNSGTTSFTFTVTRAGDTTTTATVDYTAAGSGANPTDAADFSGAVTGTASFAIGAATATVTIDVAGDTTPESDETFDVTLSNAVGSGAISAIVGTPASATGTILNDDAATTIAIAATDATKAEGNTGTTSFTFTVTRSGVTTGTSSATWTVTGSGANPANTTTDLTAPIAGTVSFAADETSQVITVLVTGDTTIEPIEGFTVTLSAPSSGTAISTAAADGSIVNDDLSISLPTTATSTTEGNSGSAPVSVTVTRTGDTTVSTTVDWAVTGSGTNAANPTDFAGNVLPSGTVTFAIGETTQTINFNIQGDTTVELDETFTLTLSNASGGAVIGTATQGGTIVTDDVVALAAGDIAFTGYNGTTTTERVSFVVLRDLPSLTGLNFTDNGASSNGVFNSNEGLTSVVFTSPVTAGARFYLEGLALKNFDGSDAAATVTGSAISLSNTGDQVTAFQGPINAPTAVIASISSGSYITTGNVANGTSYLPTGLTLGTNAISLGGSAFNGVLNSADLDIGSTVTGPKSSILSRVNDIANWTASSATTLVVPPPIAFSVGLATPAITATPSTKVYDGSAIAIAATADDGAGGLAADTTVGNFTFTYYAGPNLTGGTIANAPINVGSYSVEIVYAGNENYTPVASTTFNFSITARPVNVTADVQTKVYGATDPVLTYSIGAQANTGLVGGDVLTGALTRDAGTSVGTYAITQGSVAAGTNYTINYVGADLSITAATLTITAEAKSKTYGGADPALTYTPSGLTNGDTAAVITGSLARATGENIGTYAITQGSVAAGSNYTINYVGANLSITAATLTITADAKSKTVGDADPALTYTFSGLTNSDTAAVITGALSRTAGETAGVYPINLGSITAGSNYSITFVGANFTINAAAAAPTFSGALVNGSDTFLNAAQRSQLTSLVLNFSAPVVIASGAFTVENIGLVTAQSAAALASSQILVTGSGTSTITLRWAAGSGVVTRGASGATGNSLADGNWRLTIDSTKVTAQSGGAQLIGSNTFGATSADNFFRMFGDNDGDGDVDGIDLIAARRAALLAPSVSNPYNAAMDSNGDGINFGQGIDSAFTSNYGKRRRSF